MGKGVGKSVNRKIKLVKICGILLNFP
jgi:hypothetical protein